MGVRWDAVVQDHGFWDEAEPPSHDALAPEADQRVQVWLFGSLADGFAERPVTVQCRGAFTVSDVIAELGRVCGRGFLDRVTAPDGSKLRNCRVFANGVPVEDETIPIRAEASHTDIELILLTAAEGG